MLACSFTWARPPHLVTPNHRDVIHQAEKAWRHRDQPWQTETAIALWERGLQEHPERVDLYIALTRSCGRAYRHSQTAKERDFWSNEGRAYGALAVAKNPANPEAYAHYGEALGQWAQAHKGIHSLGAVRDAVNALQKAVALRPDYAYARMLLASFYRQSPRFFSVGDKAGALEEARLAVKYGPGVAINHLVLARCYLDFGKKEEARKELEFITRMKPPPDAVPETRADQETARELLKNL